MIVSIVSHKKVIIINVEAIVMEDIYTGKSYS